jgi:hypothetical protein
MGNTPQSDVSAAAGALIAAVDAKAKESAFAQFGPEIGEWSFDIAMSLPPHAQLPASASDCANAVAAFNAAEAGLAGMLPNQYSLTDEASLIMQALATLPDPRRAAVARRYGRRGRKSGATSGLSSIDGRKRGA